MAHLEREMDGLAEPSMPAMPSVVNQMKELSAPGGRKSSMDKDEAVLAGITSEKKKYSFATPNIRKTRQSVSTLASKDESAKKVIIWKIRLTAKQQKDIADAFHAFDVHGTGYMSTLDLRVALKALGFEARKEEMKKILEKWDRGYTGKLCYADFMNVIEEKLGEPDTKEDILKSFKMFDKDNIGRISFKNLRSVADELGEDCNDEEIAEMLAEADLDDDGTLDEEEFIRILKKTSAF